MSKFIFESYHFDKEKLSACFEYSFENGISFIEKVQFEAEPNYDEVTLEKALFFAFVLIGTSYFKSFPSPNIEINFLLDDWQAKFFNSVFQEGLSQFAYENNLNRDNLAHFIGSSNDNSKPCEYKGEGILVLQSGGKDSLLTAKLLKENNKEFTSFYVSSGKYHPKLIDRLGFRLVTALRTIDIDNLKISSDNGGKNGHVPITYIIQSLAVIQAILLGKSDILTSVAHEGEEPHDLIGDLTVTHQWSKTWSAETQFSEYVSKYISPDIRIGSPLRAYSELLVAKMFVDHAWKDFGHIFSSCNVANYLQGEDNSELKWCGDCPKCANSYLLFSPFLPANELKSIFDNQDLFIKSSLRMIFKGLLGVDGVSKPFECVGEIDELRKAYHLSQEIGDYQSLPFDVPNSTFDYMKLYPAQDWAVKMLK
ncbi:MAG: hypothetical protein WCK26_00790 [Candidatus Saccharibacteria bacterium]